MKDKKKQMDEFKSFLRQQRKDLFSVLSTKIIKNKKKYDRKNHKEIDHE